MQTYVMLTKLSPEALKEPGSVGPLNREVEDRIKQEVPEVQWRANYAVLGPYDYLDIFEAPDAEAATKVALVVRSFGNATTETWLATEWQRFLGLAQDLSEGKQAA